LRDPALPVLRQSWPDAASLPGLPALERFAPAEAEQLRQGHVFLAGLLQAPIVAVAGLINAGKSSLVAAFLSPEGRARVLRGVARRAGTHRFCLWTPAAWERDDAFRDALTRLLAEIFPEPPEPLDAAPEAAREQQRSRAHLRRPLLAFDPALDAHGLCLLDCPDIQRRDTDDAAGRQSRLEALRAAGRICSGVLMVMPRNQLEIVQVADVLEALPSALRIAAVNFVGNEPPAWSTTVATTCFRSALDSRWASPMNPRMLTPWTPTSRSKSMRRLRLTSSTAPSLVNGVGRIGRTP